MALVSDNWQMAALTQRDTERLLEGVARLTEPQTVDGIRQESVRVVHGLIPSVSASWNEISAAGIEAVIVPGAEYWPGMEDSFTRALADHPVIAHIRRTNDGRPRAISDFWSIDEFHRSALYQDFYSLLQAEDQLSFTVPTPDVLIGVAVNRDSVGFTQRERTLANLLRPYVLQAYRNAVAIEQIGRLMSIVDDLTSDQDAGLVTLRGVATAKQLTPTATALLARWFPDDPSGQLPEQVAEWLRSLDEEETRTPTWPLVFEEGGRRLVVRRLQGVRPADGDVLHVSEHPTGHHAQNLTRLGLSPRQSEVVRLASDGLSNAEIARDLGLSVRTVEGHMGQALERLGVRSRTAAANLIHQLDVQDGAA